MSGLELITAIDAMGNDVSEVIKSRAKKFVVAWLGQRQRECIVDIRSFRGLVLIVCECYLFKGVYLVKEERVETDVVSDGVYLVGEGIGKVETLSSKEEEEEEEEEEETSEIISEKEGECDEEISNSDIV